MVYLQRYKAVFNTWDIEFSDLGALQYGFILDSDPNPNVFTQMNGLIKAFAISLIF